MTYLLIIFIWTITGAFAAVATYHTTMSRGEPDRWLWLRLGVVALTGPLLVVGLAFLFVVNWASGKEI